MVTPKETALGTARARFVEGLPRKASELRGAVALLAASPEEVRPREEMRRRLHALYASAQVFRIGPLAEALKDALASLDAAREEGRGLSQADLDALATLAATLPGLGGDAPVGTSSTVPPADDEAVTTPGILWAPAPSGVGSALPAPPPPDAGPPGGRGGKTTLTGLAPGREEPRQAPAPRRRASERPPKSTIPGLPRAAPAGAGAVLVGEDEGSTPPSDARAAPAGHPPSRHPTPLDTVISVLVVDTAQEQARIRAALPPDRFELVAAADPEAALRLARTSGPDVVLADRDLVRRPGFDFVERLRGDPLTDFVPVVLMLSAGSANDLLAVREEGADETLGKPLDARSLVRTLVRVTGNLPGEAGHLLGLGEITPAQLAERLADELRRGIAESAELGRDVRVPMGDGAEVLAAAWSAISRIRAHVAQRSGGRVRFRDDLRRGGPALMALVDEEVPDTSSAADVALGGRRVIVADDDPAVVWFFAGVLREEGVEVFEAADGRQALEEARRRRPDAIISDIMMPELDGFALCKALKRDPALADVPVILLSWKEDFLQRMRELSAGASGYLRKEAGSQQILTRVREVLRPRARLEAELRAGGEVRGRIEGVGMGTLLRSVSVASPDARIIARDAWNLYEVDLRGGALVDLTRTATDGSFVRGRGALAQLLGATSGRFTVTPSDTPVRGSFEGSLDATLAEGTAALGALLDAVSGRGLPLAAKLELDDDALAAYVRTSPEPIRELVEHLREGAGPRELLLSGDVAPDALEAALVDLARRGAIRGVRGPTGEDRIEAAREARRKGSDIPSTRPPAPQGLPGADVSSLDWLATEETTGDILDDARRMAAREAETVRIRAVTGAGDLDAPFEGGDLGPEAAGVQPAGEPAAGPSERPDPSAAPGARALAAAARSAAIGLAPPRPGGGAALDDEPEPIALTRPSVRPTDRVAPRTPSVEAGAPGREAPMPSGEEEITAELLPEQVIASVAAPREPAARRPPPPSERPPPPPSGRAPADRTDARARPLASTQPPSSVSDAADAAGELDGVDEEPSMLGTFVLLVLLVVAGFFGFRWIMGGLRSEEPPPVREPHGVLSPGAQPPVAVAPAEGAALPEGSPPALAGEGAPAQARGESLADHAGRLEPLPASPGATPLLPTQGLLRIDAPDDGERVEVRVGARSLGRVPLQVALEEGRHELAFGRGRGEVVRFVHVRAGQTRVLQAP